MISGYRHCVQTALDAQQIKRAKTIIAADCLHKTNYKAWVWYTSNKIYSCLWVLVGESRNSFLQSTFLSRHQQHQQQQHWLITKDGIMQLLQITLHTETCPELSALTFIILLINYNKCEKWIHSYKWHNGQNSKLWKLLGRNKITIVMKG